MPFRPLADLGSWDDLLPAPPRIHAGPSPTPRSSRWMVYDAAGNILSVHPDRATAETEAARLRQEETR